VIRSDQYWGVAEWVVVLIWKATTLTGTAALVYVNVSQHMPPEGHFGLGLLTAGWALMFLFTQPDV
jgi:hypothetical protein